MLRVLNEFKTGIVTSVEHITEHVRRETTINSTPPEYKTNLIPIETSRKPRIKWTTEANRQNFEKTTTEPLEPLQEPVVGNPSLVSRELIKDKVGNDHPFVMQRSDDDETTAIGATESSVVKRTLGPFDRVLDHFARRHNATFPDDFRKSNITIRDLKEKFPNHFAKNNTFDYDFYDDGAKADNRKKFMEYYEIFQYYYDDSPNITLWEKEGDTTEIVEVTTSGQLETTTVEGGESNIQSKADSLHLSEEFISSQEILTTSQDSTTELNDNAFSTNSFDSHPTFTFPQVENLVTLQTNANNHPKTTTSYLINTDPTLHLSEHSFVPTFETSTIPTFSLKLRSNENDESETNLNQNAETSTTTDSMTTTTVQIDQTTTTGSNNFWTKVEGKNLEDDTSTVSTSTFDSGVKQDEQSTTENIIARNFESTLRSTSEFKDSTTETTLYTSSITDNYNSQEESTLSITTDFDGLENSNSGKTTTDVTELPLTTVSAKQFYVDFLSQAKSLDEEESTTVDRTSTLFDTTTEFISTTEAAELSALLFESTTMETFSFDSLGKIETTTMEIDSTTSNDFKSLETKSGSMSDTESTKETTTELISTTTDETTTLSDSLSELLFKAETTTLSPVDEEGSTQGTTLETLSTITSEVATSALDTTSELPITFETIIQSRTDEAISTLETTSERFSTDTFSVSALLLEAETTTQSSVDEESSTTQETTSERLSTITTDITTTAFANTLEPLSAFETIIQSTTEEQISTLESTSELISTITSDITTNDLVSTPALSFATEALIQSRTDEPVSALETTSERLSTFTSDVTTTAVDTTSEFSSKFETTIQSTTDKQLTGLESTSELASTITQDATTLSLHTTSQILSKSDSENSTTVELSTVSPGTLTTISTPTDFTNENVQSRAAEELIFYPRDSKKDIEYYYVYEEYEVNEQNERIPEKNETSRTDTNNEATKLKNNQKRDNSFEYYVESMSSSREFRKKIDNYLKINYHL